MHNEPASFVELTSTRTLRKYTDEERQSHCEDWKKSGLSMSEYCRQSGLAVSSLSKWLNESNRKLTEGILQEQSITSSPILTGVEIILVSGIRLRFARTPISEILRFIKALES